MIQIYLHQIFFCLNETKIQNIQTHQEIQNVILNKFKILSCYDQHCTMVLYHTNMVLSHTFSKINSGTPFLIYFLNENTWQALHIIVIYKPQQMNAIFFISILKNIVTKIPTNCPTIIIGDFSINMLMNTIESITLQNYMNIDDFHITFIQSTTPNNTQINHIWTKI